MPPARVTKPKLDKRDAERFVREIAAGNECDYVLVPFPSYRKSHQGANMKSEQYTPYFVLCYPNSRFHTGWLVCPFVLNGYCEVSKGLLEIDTKKGGTNKFGKHINDHKKANGECLIERPLQEKCRASIADAAALAVVLDLRPLGFAENHDGIAKYAEAVFKAGQTVPFGANISTNSYVPSRTAVKNALERLAVQKRKNFARIFLESLESLGGAVTIDGVNLKVQGRHYYDFTVHHIDVVRPKSVLDLPKFQLKTSTILFVEGPPVGTANNIRSHLDSNLKSQFGTSFDAIQKNYTVVTDGAAVMACVAGSSVSRALAPLDQTWMRCHVHVLHNVMKHMMKNCNTDQILIKIAEDFKSMKKVVENSKRYGWNSMLPLSYRLIQEVDTRFGTHFIVAERFLKSASRVWDLIKAQNLSAASTKFESILQLTENGVSFPTIEAIVDAFKPLYNGTVLFQTSNEPKLHEVLPNLQYMLKELSRIEHGDFVEREENLRVRPSIYSMRLCGALKLELMKIEIHDLWLVACFLYPYLRDMHFWEDSVEKLQGMETPEAPIQFLLILLATSMRRT